jgi:hypothetical protein
VSGRRPNSYNSPIKRSVSARSVPFGDNGVDDILHRQRRHELHLAFRRRVLHDVHAHVLKPGPRDESRQAASQLGVAAFAVSGLSV